MLDTELIAEKNYNWFEIMIDQCRYFKSVGYKNIKISAMTYGLGMSGPSNPIREFINTVTNELGYDITVLVGLPQLLRDRTPIYEKQYAIPYDTWLKKYDYINRMNSINAHFIPVLSMHIKAILYTDVDTGRYLGCWIGSGNLSNSFEENVFVYLDSNKSGLASFIAAKYNGILNSYIHARLMRDGSRDLQEHDPDYEYINAYDDKNSVEFKKRYYNAY